MYDLAVIGLGFWGTSAARLSRAAGALTFTVDDSRPLAASRAAAGIVQESWYRQQTVSKMTTGVFDRADLTYGIDWLSETCGLERTGETFTSYQDPRPRRREDVYLLPTAGRLLDAPDICATVSGLIRTEGWLLVADDGAALGEARRVFLAAGWWTDRVLATSGLPGVGVRALLGRALVVSSDYTGDVRTHLPRPYKHLTVRPYEGNHRIGDTTEVLDRLSDRSPYDYLRRSFREITGNDCFEVEELAGARPVCDQMVVREVAPGLVVATGGHRVGLALAPAAARRGLRMLGVDA